MKTRSAAIFLGFLFVIICFCCGFDCAPKRICRFTGGSGNPSNPNGPQKKRAMPTASRKLKSNFPKGRGAPPPSKPKMRGIWTRAASWARAATPFIRRYWRKQTAARQEEHRMLPKGPARPPAPSPEKRDIAAWAATSMREPDRERSTLLTTC